MPTYPGTEACAGFNATVRPARGPAILDRPQRISCLLLPRRSKSASLDASCEDGCCASTPSSYAPPTRELGPGPLFGVSMFQVLTPR